MTAPVDGDRLRRALGGEDLRWLLDRVRRRLARGEPLTGTVSASVPSQRQRRAVEQLLGRPPGRGASLSVSLDELDALLRRSSLHPDGLAAAVSMLTGPVVELAAVEAARQQAWQRALAPLAEVAADRPELRPWYDDSRTRGLIARLCGDADRAGPVLADLAQVLAALPAAGLPMARFAAATTTDPHALDQGRPLATLAESAIRSGWPVETPAAAGSAQHRRASWDAVGVFLDELSSTVLVLNLPAAPGTRLAGLCAAGSELGEPLLLTLRQLARDPSRFTASQVYVCENPAVVAAAADSLGPGCPPLVCVNGQPSSAALRLLVQLGQGSAQLRYHGDFDWGGLRIGNLLRSRLDWQPWRFDAAAYRAAADRPARPLAGTPVSADWDAELGPEMTRHGVRIDEELVLDDLLADLAG